MCSKILFSKILARRNRRKQDWLIYVAIVIVISSFQEHASSLSPREVTFTRCNPMLTVNWSTTFSNHYSSWLQARFLNLRQHQGRILLAQTSTNLLIMDISWISDQLTHLRTPTLDLTLQGRKKKVADKLSFNSTCCWNPEVCFENFLEN